jgi:hypothetical protein
MHQKEHQEADEVAMLYDEGLANWYSFVLK